MRFLRVSRRRDLKCMTKVASAVLIMREANAPSWTSDTDLGLAAWTEQYIQWLTSAPIAIQESVATK